MKTCIKCNQARPAVDYYRATAGGRQGTCKQCMKAASAAADKLRGPSASQAAAKDMQEDLRKYSQPTK